MASYKIQRMVIWNLGIIIVDIFFFSPAFIGLKLQGGTNTQKMIVQTLIFLSIVAFIWGNIHLFRETIDELPMTEVKEKKDYRLAIKQNRKKKTFSKSITYILKQIDRLNKKIDTLEDMLLQKFKKEELSYEKFSAPLKEIEELFYMNLRGMINKLNVFDEEEYMQILNKQVQFSRRIIEEKKKIYKEYITFIERSIEDNEQILLKLDQLVLEFSKFQSLEEKEIEHMPAMKSIDEVIGKAKFYH